MVDYLLNLLEIVMLFLKVHTYFDIAIFIK